MDIEFPREAFIPTAERSKYGAAKLVPIFPEVSERPSQSSVLNILLSLPPNATRSGLIKPGDLPGPNALYEARFHSWESQSAAPTASALTQSAGT